MKRGRERHSWRRIDGIVLLDKPLGLSSNDALQNVKRLFRAEKAGHTGSLDPLATGLLPICFGEATKLCGLLLDGNKHYQARIGIGSSTTTGDLEGELKATSDPALVTEQQVVEALPRFLGTISQIPPMHSALKYQGRALYELAREGQQIDRPAREVQIHRLELIGYRPGVLEIDVVCSKGTYIRTLAEDIAASLEQQAHLLALRRIGAEPFLAPVRMSTLDEIADAANRGEAAVDELMTPAVAGVGHWPKWQADELQLRLLLQGGMPAVEGLAPGRVAVLDARQQLRGLARYHEGRVFPERMLLVD